jgi:hypothetical protein
MSNCQLSEYTLQNKKNVQHNLISLNTLTKCIFLFMLYLKRRAVSFSPQQTLHKRMKELSTPLSSSYRDSLFLNK